MVLGSDNDQFAMQKDQRSLSQLSFAGLSAHEHIRRHFYDMRALKRSSVQNFVLIFKHLRLATFLLGKEKCWIDYRAAFRRLKSILICTLQTRPQPLLLRPQSDQTVKMVIGVISKAAVAPLWSLADEKNHEACGGRFTLDV